MSSEWTALSVAGGVGLLFTGLALATQGIQSAVGRTLATQLPRAAGRERRAFGLGLACALCAPASHAQPSAVVGFASGGSMRLGPALWASLGVGFAVVATGWATVAAALLSASGVALETSLALAAVAAWVFGGHRAGAWARWVVGWALFGLGVIWMSTGLAGTTVRLDSSTLSTAVRLALLCASGAMFAALLRSAGVVVAGALCAAAGGALEVTSACALLAGAQAGAGLAVLGTAGAERGEGKQTAMGLALQQGLHAPLGLVLLALTLPILSDPPAAVGHPMILLCLFQTTLWLAGVLVYFPFHTLARDALEQHVPAEEGAGATSLQIPELALTGTAERTERMATITRHMARNVLGGGRVSDFRVESDGREAKTLEAEVVGIHRRLATRSLLPDEADRALELTRRATTLSTLLYELCELRSREGELAPMAGKPIEARLRQLELGALHLVDRCAAPVVGETGETVEGEWRNVELHRLDLERHLVQAAVNGTLTTHVVVSLLDRLTGLDRVLRGAVELVVGEVAARPSTLREKLADWLVRGAPRPGDPDPDPAPSPETEQREDPVHAA